MTVTRRFLVAPSLARLVRKERGAIRMTEGYFAPKGGRTSYVRIEGGQCQLVLVSTGPNGPSEERTDVPRAHGDALLDVCAGKVVFDRSRLGIGGGQEAFVDRFSTPAPLDVVTVEFKDDQAAKAFSAPAWVGGEVTAEGAYENRALATQGLPATTEIALSNAALDALLDALEDRFGLSRPGSRRVEEDTGVMDALRRLSTTGATAPVTANVAAPLAASVPVEETPSLAEAMPAAEAAPVETAPAEIAETATFPSETAEFSVEAPSDMTADAAEVQTSPAENPDTRIDSILEGLSQVLDPAATGRAPVVDLDTWGEGRPARRAKGS